MEAADVRNKKRNQEEQEKGIGTAGKRKKKKSLGVRGGKYKMYVIRGNSTGVSKQQSIKNALLKSGENKRKTEESPEGSRDKEKIRKNEKSEEKQVWKTGNENVSTESLFDKWAKKWEKKWEEMDKRIRILEEEVMGKKSEEKKEQPGIRGENEVEVEVGKVLCERIEEIEFQLERNKKLEEEREDLGLIREETSGNDLNRDYMKKIIWKDEMKERKEKRNNIVIEYGVKDVQSKEDVKELIRRKLKVNINIVKMWRIRGKVKKLGIECGSWKEKSEVMKNKSKLGDTDIYIDNDLTWRERENRRRLVQYKEELLKEGKVKKVKVGYNKICVDGIWSRWDERTENFYQEKEEIEEKVEEEISTRENLKGLGDLMKALEEQIADQRAYWEELRRKE